MGIDTIKVKIAATIRDSVYNLVIHNKNTLDNKEYFEKLKYFIQLLEGVSNEAYIDGILDPNTKRFITSSKFYSLDQAMREKLEQDARERKRKIITTVGIGANINSQSARDEIDKLLNKPGLMSNVFYGKAKLSDKEIWYMENIWKIQL